MHPAGPAPARGRSRDPRRTPNRDALPLQPLEEAPAQLGLHPVLIGERRDVVAHREVERAVARLTRLPASPASVTVRDRTKATSTLTTCSRYHRRGRNAKSSAISFA